MSEHGRHGATLTGESDRDTTVIGLLADPDTPTEVAEKVAGQLSPLLSDYVDGEVVWDVRTMTHPVTASVQDPEQVLDAVADHAAEAGWDMGVYLTDLPIQHGSRPILADIDHDRNVAGLSLPGFGAVRQHEKVRNAVVRLVADLAGVADAGLDQEEHHPGRLGRALGRRLGRIRAVEGDEGRHTRRYVTSPGYGRVRLLLGMVRTNEPWKLVLGMRTALAAVVGTSAYLTINSTIWLLSTRLGAPKLALTMVVAVALMVVWIIGAHSLWERAQDAEEREEVWLFNVSTVLTLSIGVLVMTAAVYVLTLLGSLFFLEPSVFAQSLGRPPTWGDHLLLSWLATGLATVAGALGSGLDSEEAVRRAAYGYRERQRRDEVGEEQESGQGTGNDDGDRGDRSSSSS
ncbi:hypothetical protein GCM10023201_08720 [Actinomycetospora corticicola]|uniref:Uncharacterized membrane protein YidH (DUF202 family) n=1 Tax=Actinomycetospora corticicola TaxID=663602 RepID=A0A7Y9DTM3_9PSEU|nr:hypothetical protein [Actinomycetospora corticicola]NYD35293.1 uncharacterized membrane protein YidH (DUF202 family) [Actinomycetospora corticicola]